MVSFLQYDKKWSETQIKEASTAFNLKWLM